MNILIVTQDYPDINRNVYTFVKQLVDELARKGNKCCVIAPYSITKNRKFYASHEVQNVEGPGEIVILRPNHLSFSNLRIAGISLSEYFRRRAIRKALRSLPFKPDLVYAHFWRSGREIYDYAKNNKIPLFVATGESKIPSTDISDSYSEFYEYVRGVICVSTKNKEESVANKMTVEEKCVVIPNAVNEKVFHKKNRHDCREILSIPQNAFVVAFCGTLCHRKGVKVLSDAIDDIDGQQVYSLFIGAYHDERPSCKNILFKGVVSHEQIADYLNAADVFVLPTLHEGCCNAIIEAMACGLPIVSSDRSFNWDVLNESNSILVNPESVNEVANAICMLRDDKEKREKLSIGALKTAEELTIGKRAARIMNFIESKM